MFFMSFHSPKMFYCSPCPTAAPASLNMQVVSTNLAKTLVANLNMTSHCDVTNSVYPVTMTAIHHCSILEFGRGASNQAIAPSSPDFCTPLLPFLHEWVDFDFSLSLQLHKLWKSVVYVSKWSWNLLKSLLCKFHVPEGIRQPRMLRSIWRTHTTTWRKTALLACNLKRPIKVFNAYVASALVLPLLTLTLSVSRQSICGWAANI